MTNRVITTRFDDETRLVLLLSDPHLRAEDVEGLEALCMAPLDWNRVLGMLILHRTAGQAWVNLAQHGLGTRTRFRASSALSVLRTVLKGQQLHAEEQIDSNVELITAFEAAGIRSVMMKGAVMARMGYACLGVRPFLDNDFLFDPDDIGRVGELLKELGYVQGLWNPQTGVVDAASRSEVLLHPLTSHEVFPYTKPTTDATISDSHTIDVHFSLDLMTGNRSDEAVRELLTRRVAIAGNANGDMWALEREDMFVFLCVHYQREASNRREVEELRDLLLYKITDLLALLSDRAQPLDLDRLTQRVKASGFEREVFYALAHLDELYPGRLPAGLLERSRPTGSVDFVHQISHNGQPVHTWSGSVAERFFSPQRVSELARA